jgi:hypothetical protein
MKPVAEQKRIQVTLKPDLAQALKECAEPFNSSGSLGAMREMTREEALVSTLGWELLSRGGLPFRLS